MTEQEYREMLDAMATDGKGEKKFWSPKEGKNVIRILPPIKPLGEKLFYFHHKVHWIGGKPFESWNQQIVDAEGNAYTPRQSVLDKMAQKFWNAGTKGSDEWEVAKALSSRDRYIYRIVVRGKDDETIPEFYESGPQIFKVLKDLVMEGEYGNIVDPLTGRDFFLIKEGKGERANYDTSKIGPSEKPIFAEKEQIKVVLTNAKNLSYNSLITMSTEQDMQEALDAFFESKGIPTKGYVAGGTAPKKTATATEDDEEEFQAKPAKSSKPTVQESASSDEVDDLLKDFM